MSRIDRYGYRGNAGSVPSVLKLAQALQLDEDFLVAVSGLPDDRRYEPVPAPSKKDGRPREVYKPDRKIRLIQRRMVDRFFRRPRVVRWPFYVFGGIHKNALLKGDSRDHVACAKRHCGAKRVLKLDIEDFFGNVSAELVLNVFRDLLRWSEEPARLATNLCVRNGSLPQGGITSSYLALLSLFDVEPRVVRILETKGLTYTRYVDDITVSSKYAGQDFDSVMKLIEQALIPKGFSINSRKIENITNGLHAISVHGLNVAFSRPVLPKKEVRRIKSVCRQTVLDAKEVGRRSVVYRRRFNRSMGLINKMARVGSPEHGKFVSRLQEVRPLPSFVDYQISTDLGIALRNSFDKSGATYWYWKRFNRLMARLDLIGLDNPDWAQSLRKLMANYRPTFKDSS